MKRFFFALSLLYSSLAYSQQVSLTLSDKFKLPKDAWAFKMGDCYYSVDGTGPVYLRKYDRNMNELKKTKQESKNIVVPAYGSYFFPFGERLVYYYFQYNSGTVQLFLAEIDSVTLTVKDSREVFAIPYKMDAISRGLPSAYFSTIS